MALDKFENLPGIIHELQDGGLQISSASTAPAVLVLGTASQGIAGRKVQVVRAQESENQFGREGTLIRGMYETKAGGSTNTYLMRINTKSAILYGVGTDDQVLSPTSIETLIKDGSAADIYFVRYQKPSTVGPNATVGRLKIKNALGVLVYDNNPGSQPIDLGEVIVSGSFVGGEDIGALGDPTDFISLREIAQDKTPFTQSIPAQLITPTVYPLSATPDVGTLVVTIDKAGTPIVLTTPAQYTLVGDTVTLTSAAALLADHKAITFDYEVAGDPASDVFAASVSIPSFTLTHAPVAGSVIAKIAGTEIVKTAFTVSGTTVTFSPTSLTDNKAVQFLYSYDAETLYTLRDGADGLNPSKMEMYEALEEAYRSLENDEIDIVVPMNVYLDDKNVADGATIVLSSDESVAVGQRYPVAGSEGDALGKLYIEEYQGEFFYFWDINGDGEAEIFPSVGAASSLTKIDGSDLSVSDFHEVNFAYQLANFAFSLSVNDNEAQGVIGVNPPASFSAKDVANWIGKEPLYDATGVVTQDGSGLLGNKFMAGSISREQGFFATESGFLPATASFETNVDIIKDRNGHMIDIGKYLSTVAMYLTFFNPVDATGFGYHSIMAGYYAGFYSALPSNSSPTNKELKGVRTPFRISKTKLNSLAKLKYVAVKQKEAAIKISDAPTSARNDSDFTRLTTVRIIKDVIDAVRKVAEPYIGEPNTAVARVALETGIVRELALLQSTGFIQRFAAKVSATTTQQIQGDATVELTIVPAFELRKITVITSLAKQ